MIIVAQMQNIVNDDYSMEDLRKLIFQTYLTCSLNKLVYNLMKIFHRAGLRMKMEGSQRNSS